jgi:hypothetical protein
LPREILTQAALSLRELLLSEAKEAVPLIPGGRFLEALYYLEAYKPKQP